MSNLQPYIAQISIDAHARDLYADVANHVASQGSPFTTIRGAISRILRSIRGGRTFSPASPTTRAQTAG